MSISRLSLALDGTCALPDEGRILIFNPPAMVDLSALDKERVHVVQGFYPDYAALLRRGFDASSTAKGDYAAAIVYLPRAKALALSMVAQASAATGGGLVIVDGQKTDGIMSMLKALKGRVEVLGTVSKAHGKLAWFRCENSDDLGDWIAKDRQVTGGFTTHPGVFSADGPDKGSQVLMAALSDKIKGHGADLGAGWGLLSREILKREAVTTLDLIEADHTALECARRNITDARAQFHWADAASWGQGGDKGAHLNFVISNPPFHTGRKGDPDLGRAFIRAAAGMLAPSGQFWMVANRHLPYEATLDAYFRHVSEVGRDSGFKVFHAIRPRRIPQPVT